MKTKIALAAAFLLLLACPQFVHAVDTCKTGTLESYIELGSAGCQFNGAIYYNFAFGSPSTVSISASEILVIPSLVTSTTLFPGLNFEPFVTAAGWTAAAGNTKLFNITYDVTSMLPIAPSSAALTLDLGKAKVSGTIGSAKVTEAVSTPTTSSSLEVYDTCDDVCTVQKIDSVTITPASTLHTILTVLLNGGNGGVELDSFAANDSFGV
jgi:hypothetical protein